MSVSIVELDERVRVDLCNRSFAISRKYSGGRTGFLNVGLSSSV